MNTLPRPTVPQPYRNVSGNSMFNLGTDRKIPAQGLVPAPTPFPGAPAAYYSFGFLSNAQVTNKIMARGIRGGSDAHIGAGSLLFKKHGPLSDDKDGHQVVDLHLLNYILDSNRETYQTMEDCMRWVPLGTVVTDLVAKGLGKRIYNYGASGCGKSRSYWTGRLPALTDVWVILKKVKLYGTCVTPDSGVVQDNLSGPRMVWQFVPYALSSGGKPSSDDLMFEEPTKLSNGQVISKKSYGRAIMIGTILQDVMERSMSEMGSAEIYAQLRNSEVTSAKMVNYVK